MSARDPLVFEQMRPFDLFLIAPSASAFASIADPATTAVSLAWVGVVGALGGSLLTGLIAFLVSWQSERGKERALQSEQMYEDRKVKRETFARYLTSALTTHDVISTLARREIEKNQMFRSPAGLATKMAESAEWKLFNVHFGQVLFLLDDAGVKTLHQFGPAMLEAAVSSGLDKSTPPWDQQISGVLAAMRRALQ